jgi:hypothetical protein
MRNSAQGDTGQAGDLFHIGHLRFRLPAAIRCPDRDYVPLSKEHALFEL